jgi:hypothetical protein
MKGSTVVVFLFSYDLLSVVTGFYPKTNMRKGIGGIIEDCDIAEGDSNEKVIMKSALRHLYDKAGVVEQDLQGIFAIDYSRLNKPNHECDPGKVSKQYYLVAIANSEFALPQFVSKYTLTDRRFANLKTVLTSWKRKRATKKFTGDGKKFIWIGGDPERVDLHHVIGLVHALRDVRDLVYGEEVGVPFRRLLHQLEREGVDINVYENVVKKTLAIK